MAESQSERSKAGPHRRAITRMLRATGLVHVPEEAPLVELLKDLATDLDNGGGGRTRTAYLSALKDLRRLLNNEVGRPRGSAESSSAEPTQEPGPEESSEEPTPAPTSLAKFKQERGIG